MIVSDDEEIVITHQKREGGQIMADNCARSRTLGHEKKDGSLDEDKIEFRTARRKK
jgi:hypothetical protein